MKEKKEYKMDIFKSRKAKKEYFEKFYNPVLEKWPMPYESFFINTYYGKTHLLKCGSSDLPTVFLTNGIGMDILFWSDTHLLRNLYNNFQVFLPDRIGDPGRSEIDIKIKSSSDYVNWMKELLDNLKLKKVNFIGIHQGGWEVLAYAIYLPEYTGKIISITPGGGIYSMRPGAVMKMFFANSSVKKLEQYLRSSVAPSYKWNDHWLATKVQGAMFLKENTTPLFIMPRKFSGNELIRIKAKTLVLIGEYNLWYNLKKLKKRAKEYINDIEIRIIQNAGNGILYEQPDVSSKIMIDFLLRN